MLEDGKPLWTSPRQLPGQATLVLGVLGVEGQKPSQQLGAPSSELVKPETSFWCWRLLCLFRSHVGRALRKRVALETQSRWRGVSVHVRKEQRA